MISFTRCGFIFVVFSKEDWIAYKKAFALFTDCYKQSVDLFFMFVYPSLQQPTTFTISTVLRPGGDCLWLDTLDRCGGLR